MTKRLATRRRNATERMREVAAMPPLDSIDDDAMLTRDQVATLSNISSKTYANREAAGRPIIPVVRIGGIPRYRAGVVKQYLRGQVGSDAARVAAPNRRPESTPQPE